MICSGNNRVRKIVAHFNAVDVIPLHTQTTQMKNKQKNPCWSEVCGSVSDEHM